MKITLTTNPNGTKTVTAGDWKATVFPEDATGATLKPLTFGMDDGRTIADFEYTGEGEPAVDDDFIDFWSEVSRAIVRLEAS